MGLFGGSKSDEARTQLDATAARLSAMSRADVADELLRTTFGPGARGEGNIVAMPEILAPYDPTGSGHFAGMPLETYREIQWIIEEALQHLEHQGLVVMSVAGTTHTYTCFRATLTGRNRLGLPGRC
jgi:hypothetical protein